jgi:hypothetical protein
LKKLNQVDFGCLKIFGGLNQFKAASLRAQLYRLNALREMEEYIDSEKLLTADAKHEKLVDALRIVEAGLKVLNELDDAEAPSQTKEYLSEYVSLSNAIETKSSLEALKANLQNALSKPSD